MARSKIRVGIAEIRRENLRNKVAIALTQNVPENEIWKHLGLDRKQARLHIASIFEEWRHARVEAVEEKIAREVRKLDLVEMIAWQELAASKKHFPKGEEAKDKDDTVPADPRFMKVVIDCITKRTELYGYTEGTSRADKVAPDSQQAKTAEAADLMLSLGNPDGMSQAEVDARIEAMEQLRLAQDRLANFTDGLGAGNN